jgi:hypothetical protein
MREKTVYYDIGEETESESAYKAQRKLHKRLQKPYEAQ